MVVHLREITEERCSNGRKREGIYTERQAKEIYKAEDVDGET